MIITLKLLLLATLIMSTVAASGSQRATCSVSPATAAPGSAVVVTVNGITRQVTPSGWFVLYDTGPFTIQAVSSMDFPPTYGDNGSSVIDWTGPTAHFQFIVQSDHGTHLVEAKYRKTFASCFYLVP